MESRVLLCIDIFLGFFFFIFYIIIFYLQTLETLESDQLPVLCMKCSQGSLKKPILSDEEHKLVALVVNLDKLEYTVNWLKKLHQKILFLCTHADVMFFHTMLVATLFSSVFCHI